MSLADAALLTGEFEGVEEQGDAEDAKSSGQWTVDSGQREVFSSQPKRGKNHCWKPDRGRSEFDLADGDVSAPNGEEGGECGDETECID